MKAAIDIGTNTVLLLIAEVKEGEIIAIHEEQRIPRLGKGVDEHRRIDEQATERIVHVLNEYIQLIHERFPETESIIVTATSAVRDAQNKEEFLKEIKTKTGLVIRLLSGKEEAEWTTAGALSVLPSDFREDTLILDIGGGSTEIAHTVNDELKSSHSFDMGSVRFTEKFLKSTPPTLEEIEDCRNEIASFYGSRNFKISPNSKAVGVAGTLTTLASLLLKTDEYQPEVINRFEISKDEIIKFIERYRSRPHEEMLQEYPILLKGRSDIFLAGLLILDEFLAFYGFKKITVSTGGIRHGSIIKSQVGF